MGLLRNAMKAGIAMKALDIARNPQNQARAKEMLRSAMGKANKGRRSGAGVDSTGRR